MSRVAIEDGQLNIIQQGTGAPLLLVHGFPLDHQMWQGQLDGLSRNFRVMAPDLRGFGQSSRTSGTLTMSQLADDLASLLDQLNILEPVVLAGLSMGGYVALEFWHRHADRLSHLILCDTRAQADSKQAAQTRHESAENVMAAGTSQLIKAMIPKLFSAATLRQRPELVSATEQVMRLTDPETVAAALRGMAGRHDATSWLNQIQVPVLVLCGEHDAISSVDEMKSLADAIPISTFISIPDSGHMAPLENPERVNDAFQRFLTA